MRTRYKVLIEASENGGKSMGSHYGPLRKLMERGDLDSAVKVYEDAVTKFPDAANMHYNLATMRMARRKSSGDDALNALMVQILERAMELCPETPEFVNDLVAYMEEHKQQLDQVCILKKKAEEMERKQEEEKERD
ncbi:hypothetical protein PsorP6_014249 [Peronosclerospora sorghi]|uniref:Uncharacterized protein n=1 Tax=Peronosclerospora sorghi TaxID=230839 RepID=A0ACC0VIS3_9STRA|nr:hypothetical protein PsorP6_014249 [Peronosclerospora sorghi]